MLSFLPVIYFQMTNNVYMRVIRTIFVVFLTTTLSPTGVVCSKAILEQLALLLSRILRTSAVGQIELYPEFFSAYGAPCSACVESRYLTCINSTCTCLRHTYWTGSICASQNLRGGQCISSNQCRADLNYTCLQFFQCGRKIYH
jgi:hypothetical protein